MHKKVYLTFSFLLLYGLIQAQNLVPNPSFEEYKKCPISVPIPPDACRYDCGYSGGYNLDIPQWGNVKEISGVLYWRTVNQNPVHYFNDCNITHNPLNQTDLSKWYFPRTGSAYIAIYTYGQFTWGSSFEECRSYATVELTQPLQAGCKYEIAFYAKSGYCPAPSLAWPYFIPSDGLAVYLSTDSLYDDSVHPAYLYNFTPQMDFPGQLITDSVNYVRIADTIIASGGERYLTIGNFRDNAHTLLGKPPYDHGFGASYFIDDVSVIKLTPSMGIGTGNDVTICQDSSTMLSATVGFDSYTWSTGATTATITTDTAGQFWVKGDYGCITSSDTVNVEVQQPFTDPFEITGSTFLCDNPQGYEIKATTGYASYLWSTGDTEFKTKIYSEGKYFVRAEYACGAASDTIGIEVYDPPASLIIPANDTSICGGTSIVLSSIAGFSNHLWAPQPVSYDTSITVSEAKIYYLRADSPEGCNVRDSIIISIINSPDIELGEDTTGCEGTTVLLTAKVNGQESLTWNDGSFSLQKQTTQPGTYWAVAENRCFKVSDTVRVNFLDCKPFIPNLLTVNNDGKNEELFIETDIVRTFRLEIYNRWGQKIFESNEYKNSWGKQAEKGIYFYRLFDTLLNRYYQGWIEVR